MDDITFKIGNRIKQLRTVKDISQEELSLISGLNRAFIGQLERGEKNATVRTIDKICNALEVSLYEFFSFEAEEIDFATDTFIKLSSMFKELSDNQISQITDLVKQIIAFKKS